MSVMLREVRWSGGYVPPTVMPVAGSDAERSAFKKRLGYTLKKCRELAGLTQEEVAPKLLVNVQTLSRWETGTHECKPYELAQMWAIYDAPAEWLMNPSDSITEWDVRIAQSVSRGLRRGLRPDDPKRPDA